ncbi:MAG: 4-(cytidine 5'-diphospho)-2-C-methyl-D-erythritol kinase [Candidatus Latescibacteria bacterium]|jgi:4-diphosphocytidyl-2-C-methyl-D-erythritol kinase|nr:4-(cytidine 5'-diphospho)-2-C-methyl-D-erythritol kinase [Candidatus Latescibacterota bacterium]
MDSLTIESYAKVNLGLWVTGKRPDGYHDIETIMQTVDLKDTIEVSRSPSDLVITCTDPEVPTDHQNLAYQAAESLRVRYKITSGARIHIHKRIPVAAGLAGGSGNGAATLRALNRLWKIGLSESKLIQFAAELGSDVPFCMTGGTALASGRGERLEPLEVSCPGIFVLVKPLCQVSSAWAYQNLRIGLTKLDRKVNLVVCALQQSDRLKLANCLQNDLERPVLPAFPIVEQVKHLLTENGAEGVTMSGSGPTVFGIAQDRTTAEHIACSVTSSDPDLRVFVCAPVSREKIAME